SGASAINAGVFLQDEWKPTPFLTVKPGFRFDTFQATNSFDNAPDNSFGYSGIGPRLGVAWDPTHDGKTLLSAFVGQVTDAGNLLTSEQGAKKQALGIISVFFNNSYDLNSPVQQFGGAGGTVFSCDPALQQDPLLSQFFAACRPPVSQE